jgi:hypothetical protein
VGFRAGHSRQEVRLGSKTRASSISDVRFLPIIVRLQGFSGEKDADAIEKHFLPLRPLRPLREIQLLFLG